MAIALIDNASVNGDGNTAAITGRDLTGASLVILAIIELFSNAGATIPTDDEMNVYTPLTGVAFNDLFPFSACFFYCAAPVVTASMDFSYTSSGNVPGMSMIAFSGTSASPLGDESGQGYRMAVPHVPGSVTPPADDSVVVTFGGYQPDGAPTVTLVESGYTQVSDSGGTPFVSFGASIGYEIQSGAAFATDPEWTISDTGLQFIALAATFAPAGGGGGTTYPGYQSPFGWS